MWLILALTAAAAAAAWWALNPWAALYTFLGAFFYAVVYTVWLKRRTWLNIVVGGLAGSFAVLAGAAAVDPGIGAAPLVLALVLFLWTPPHFWSLAIAYRQDYEAARVPMLPVVVGDARCAKVIFLHTVLLVSASLVPAFLGLGLMYLRRRGSGRGVAASPPATGLMRAPSAKLAMVNFHASLGQLSLLLLAAILDVDGVSAARYSAVLCAATVLAACCVLPDRRRIRRTGAAAGVPALNVDARDQGESGRDRQDGRRLHAARYRQASRCASRAIAASRCW